MDMAGLGWRGKEETDLQLVKMECWRERGVLWPVSWKTPYSQQAVGGGRYGGTAGCGSGRWGEVG